MSSIDIGSPAINRASYTFPGGTSVLVDNPANETGIISTIQVYAFADAGGLKTGTFYGSSGSYTCRSFAVLGTVAAGAVRTFTGLSISVTVGDLLGCYHSSGNLEMAKVGSAGAYNAAGDLFTGTHSYVFYSGDTISIYGSGATPPTGQPGSSAAKVVVTGLI